MTTAEYKKLAASAAPDVAERMLRALGARRASRPRRDRMNRWETRYAAALASDPTVASFGFEAIRIRLAGGAWYTPDFLVEMRDGSWWVVEIKGFVREASMVRFKVAAEHGPAFGYRMIRWANGGWETIKEIRMHA